MFNPIFWFCFFLAMFGSWTYLFIQFYGWMHS